MFSNIFNVILVFDNSDILKTTQKSSQISNRATALAKVTSIV